MDLHPALAPLAWLLGNWVGEGDGFYPSIADFRYREEVVWTHNGKPMLAYAQKTWALDDGRPLHGESGYLRVAGGALELVIAHATGVVEVSTGPIADPIELRSIEVIGTPTAKEVLSLDRRIWEEDGRLHYTLGMAAVGLVHQPHLAGVLTAQRT